MGTVHKTGLGSSAALTTSLIAALFVHLTGSDLDQERGFIHNVAQYVHCFAQGKVGSGFDVSAAVYGNHRYTRFNPDVLSPVMVSFAIFSKIERKKKKGKVLNICVCYLL